MKNILPLPPIQESTPTKTPTGSKQSSSVTRRWSHGGDKTATDDDSDTVIDFAGALVFDAETAKAAVDVTEGAKKA